MRECSPPTSCHMSFVACIFFLFFLQSGEAYWWRVCYQRGLPHLVFSKYEVIAEAASTFTHLNNSLFCLTPSCTFQMRHSKQHQCLYKRHRISLVRQWLQLYKSTLFCRLSTYFLCMKVQNISESRGHSTLMKKVGAWLEDNLVFTGSL